MGRLSPVAAGAVFGVAAALMYVGVMLGKPGALILVYLTQLPLFAAGLWLGVGAAAAAGVTGSLVLLAAGDLLGAALFAALNAVPVTLLVRQALQARRRDDGPRMVSAGLLTGWLTGYALAGIGAAMLLLGGPEAMHESLRGVVAEVLDRMYSSELPNRDEIAATLASMIPGIVAASWMVMAVVNAALAQGVLARFSDELAPLARASPRSTCRSGCMLGARAHGGGGGVRRRGAVYRHQRDDVLSVAFCLGGLAVLHAAARRLSHPTIVLVIFYTRPRCSVGRFWRWPSWVCSRPGSGCAAASPRKEEQYDG